MSPPVQAGLATGGTETQVSWSEISGGGGKRRGQGAQALVRGSFHNLFTISPICMSLQISEWLLAREKNVSSVSEGAVRQELGVGEGQGKGWHWGRQCGALSQQLGIKEVG